MSQDVLDEIWQKIKSGSNPLSKDIPPLIVADDDSEQVMCVSKGKIFRRKPGDLWEEAPSVGPPSDFE